MLNMPSTNVLSLPLWCVAGDKGHCQVEYPQDSKSLSDLSEGASYDTLHFRRPSEAECSSYADWMHRLCNTTFFCPCEEHRNKKKSECTFFCLDTPETSALCAFCMPDYAHLRTLQIRRYVYRDVVKQQDVMKYMDVSGIQTYVINQAKVVFISAKDKAVAPNARSDSGCSCHTCGRSLREGFVYCSLACKVGRNMSPTRTRAPPALSLFESSVRCAPPPLPAAHPATECKPLAAQHAIQSDLVCRIVGLDRMKPAAAMLPAKRMSHNGARPLAVLSKRRSSSGSELVAFSRNASSRRKQATPCRADS